jgi:cytochrome b subunit of formate dehydrogenase
MLSFLALVLSGFALRFSEAWIAKLFFGFEGGFELRGTVHRVSAVIFMLSTFWHFIFIVMSIRGRKFVKDIFPNLSDFVQFFARLKFYLGFKYSKHPHFDRFSYVEKAEYWALVWGTGVMIITGLLLWFDNFFTQYLPDGFLNVSLIIHYWEAWLATLAILVWHLYSTVFSPDVYPMNPSWLTGTMPEDMYAHEHPGHLEEAKKEMDEQIQAEMKNLENLHHIDTDEIEKE